eukprot:8270009-Prorocentrum_lima.AAC.1
MDSFMRRSEHMRSTATQGGLLELNAACEVYRIQAVVCVKAKNHFIVLGQEGRRTATFDYDDGFWDLLSAFVLLPSRQVMRANPKHLDNPRPRRLPSLGRRHPTKLYPWCSH